MAAIPSRKDRARELFGAALELPPEQRAAFVARECAGDAALERQVAGLLDLHRDADELLPEPAPRGGETDGDRIDRYVLRRKLGEGGFGTVWLAAQDEPVRRDVALKVLKAGMDTAQVVRRFEVERQALARMDHPSIAKVFDGGVTAGGRPYFVMELVEGVPITRFCDDHGLALSDRLDLFGVVCRAVQHAHQKGIIHRDLKPSNVLVGMQDGRPVPKVIDFGIAKAARGALPGRTTMTQLGQLLGTPEYMAPEQAEPTNQDVDTRADVYSLGVLLYELLTGTRPFELKTLLDAGYAEMLRTIQQVDPPRPSTRVTTLGERLLDVARRRKVHPRSLGARIRGDLDWIVMKALEKERERRYESAAALAEDLERHLRHEPVSAGAPTRRYRLRKYVRRHRVAVAAGGAVALSIVGGAALSAAGYVEAKEQARLASNREGVARREATKSRHLYELLDSMLGSSDPHRRKGPDYTVRALLEQFDRETMQPLEAEPEVELALHRTLARSWLGLALPDRAAPHVDAATDLASRLHPAGSAAARESDLLRARLLHDRGRHDEAETIVRALLAGDRAGVAPAEVDRWRFALADSLRHRGQYDDAARELRELIDDASARGDEGRAATAKASSDLVATLLDRRNDGDLEEAEQLARSTLELRRQLLPPEADEITTDLNNLATALGARGQLEGARDLFEEVLERDLAYYGPTHVQVADAKLELAEVLRQLESLGRAESLAREAVDAFRLNAADPVRLARALHQYGGILLYMGRNDAAAAVWREALAIRQRELGEHDSVARTMQNLALALPPAQRSETLRLLQEALAMRLRLHAPDHVEVAKAQAGLGGVLLRQGEAARAEPLLRAAWETQKRAEPGRSLDGMQNASMLGECLVQLGRVREGLERQEEALAIGRAFLPAGHRELVDPLGALAQARWQAGDVAGAIAAGEEALAIARAAFGPDGGSAMRRTTFLLQIRLEAGPPPAARALADSLIAALRKSAPARKELLITPLLMQARAMRLEDDADGAEALLEEALAAADAASPRDGTVAFGLSEIAAYLLEEGRAAEAEPLLVDAVALYVAVGAVDFQPRWIATSRLGQALAAQERFQDAEPLLLAAAERLPVHMALPERRVRHATLARLVDLCERRGDREQAQRWRSTLAADPVAPLAADRR